MQARGRRRGLLLFMPLGAWIAPPATQRPESRGNFLHRLLRGGIDSRALNGVHCPVLGFQGEMVRTSRRVGVVLFQLGGPDTLEAIEPFLYNLFCDPDIIDFPFARIGRKPLAKLISATRARKVQHHYATIGGGSPIRRFTERQAGALEAELGNLGLNARCFVAMRYWHPFTREAVEQLRDAECDEVVLLPLYPQYSSTTTGSSLNEWRRLFSDDIPVHQVERFFRHEMYLEAVVEKIEEALGRFTVPERAEIVFSAHSVPLAVIEKGDPYQREIEETVELLMRRGGWRNRHRLCYQSKVGASKWLQPSLRQTLHTMASERLREVCIVPVAFVSDHVETLGEIDHEARELAARLGFTQFEMSAGLNDSPTFIRGLGQIVLETLEVSSRRMLSLQTETDWVVAG
ncbi:MAG: ferrochelatase [Acidobacteria bacterium]|nr:MAG: ferrochelatase [Acidobacteriota bacterium]